MSEATQKQTIEQTFNKTDFGHMIYENRKLFFGLLLAILLGITTFLVWRQIQQSEAMNTSIKVFDFQSGVWGDVKTGKTEAPVLIKTFSELDAKIKNAPVMFPVVLEMGKFFFDKGLFAEADTILSQVATDKSHHVAAFFLSLQRAVVLERLGKIDEAITVLTGVAKDDSLMPSKVYLELGRLHLLNGDKAQAQTQFDYVISNYPNDEQAKLARLYLGRLAQ